MRETTKEEFELFKSECLKWIKLFGLVDWRAVFAHEKLDDSFAAIRIKGLEDRIVIFILALEIYNEEESLDIRMYAFHEVMELLLHPLDYIGTCRYAQPEEFDAARHAIIRTLENVVYPVLAMDHAVR